MTTTTPVAHTLYQVTDAMQTLCMSRSVIYEQIRSGRLHTVTVGRRRYVTQAGLDAFVDLLEREADADGGAA